MYLLAGEILGLTDNSGTLNSFSTPIGEMGFKFVRTELINAREEDSISRTLENRRPGCGQSWLSWGLAKFW
jgi:hypothetical protein